MKSFSSKNVRIIKTAALYCTFLSFGLCAAIPGPTLLDLQQLVNTTTGTIAFIYLARSASCLVGSIIGGIVFDLTQRKQLIVTLCNVLFTITSLATPWSRNVATLIGLWAVCGFSMGVVDTGTNVLCLDLWGEQSAPYFQAMHFAFGVGGFIAPLIAEPFLSKQSPVEPSELALNNSDSLLWINSNGSTVMTLPENSSILEMTTTPSPQYLIPPITYSYTIIGCFSALVTTFYLVVTIVFPDEKKEKKEKKTVDKKEARNNLIYRITIGLLGQLLMSFACGTEIGYAQMLATFAVKGDLKLSKSTASYLTALFWGTFTVTRGVSVYLSYRFSAFTLVFMDLVAVTFSCALLLAFGSTYVEVLWVGTFLLAFGVASFFPSVITWVENYIHVNSKTASLFVIAATFGEMVVPLVVSQYVESEPHMLMYIIMTCSIGAVIVTFILWLIMTRKGPKK